MIPIQICYEYNLLQWFGIIAYQMLLPVIVIVLIILNKRLKKRLKK